MNVFFAKVSDLKARDYVDCVCDCYVIAYEKTIFYNGFLGESSVLKECKKLSYYTGKEVLLYGEVDFEGEKSESVLIIREGKTIGVADSIIGKENSEGTLKVYKIAGIPIGVIVGKDVLRAGVDNVVLAGAAGWIHVTKEKFDKTFYSALMAHSRLEKSVFVGSFSDCVCVAREGKLLLFELPAKVSVDFSLYHKNRINGFFRISIEV